MTRGIVESGVRPLRCAIVLPSDHTEALFRSVVRSLCGVWGGPASAIVTGGNDEPINLYWRAAIRGVDPDVVFVHSKVGGSRFRDKLRRSLDEIGVTPFWILPYDQSLTLPGTWQIQAVGDAVSDVPAVRTPFRPRTPLEIALAGLHPRGRSTLSIDAETWLGASERGSFIPLTPAWDSAADTPSGTSTVSVFQPFLYHEADDLRTATVLWNLRAAVGNFLHGNADQLQRARARLPSKSPPLDVVAIDELPKALRDELGDRVRVFEPSSYDYEPMWPRVAGVEREEQGVEDREALVRYRPLADSHTDLGRASGAYCIDVDITPEVSEELPLGFLPRASLGETILPSDPRLWGTRPRINSSGGVSLMVMPKQANRAIRIALPSVATMLGKLDGSSEYVLSDKGQYSRWVIQHLGGLQQFFELQADQRGRLLLRAFLDSHREGERPPKTYRRFMQLDDMKWVFTRERQLGRLSARVPGSIPDADWLEEWVTTLVSKDVLRVGSLLRCPDCRAGSFLPLGDFDRVFRCPRCFATVTTPAIPRVGYQLAEVMHLFLANDCDVATLALFEMAQRPVQNFSYEHDIEFEDGRNGRREIDLAGIADGRLFLGEAKRTGHIDAADFDLLARMARTLRASFIVLASDTECEGGCSADCLKSIFDMSHTRPTCLPSGGANIGPRERAERLAAEVNDMDCQVIVLCRALLRNEVS